MTQAAALRKAVSLFGAKAAIKKGRCYFYNWPSKKPWVLPPNHRCCCDGHAPGCPGGLPMFSVGRIEMGLFFMVKGQGATWENAFKEYEDRETAERESTKAARR